MWISLVHLRMLLRSWQKRLFKICQQLDESWRSRSKVCNWASWLLLFSGPPLLMVILIFLFEPCLLNLLKKFISSRLAAIKLQMMFQQDFKPIPIGGPEPGVKADLEIQLSHLDQIGREFCDSPVGGDNDCIQQEADTEGETTCPSNSHKDLWGSCLAGEKWGRQLEVGIRFPTDSTSSPWTSLSPPETFPLCWYNEPQAGGKKVTKMPTV